MKNWILSTEVLLGIKCCAHRLHHLWRSNATLICPPFIRTSRCWVTQCSVWTAAAARGGSLTLMSSRGLWSLPAPLQSWDPTTWCISQNQSHYTMTLVRGYSAGDECCSWVVNSYSCVDDLYSYTITLAVIIDFMIYRRCQKKFFWMTF